MRQIRSWVGRPITGAPVRHLTGKRWGASSGRACRPTQNPRGGPGWLDDGAPDTFDRHFRPWHFVPAALRGRVDAGRTLTVALNGPLAHVASALAVGDRVGVRWATRHHAPVALAVDPL